MNPPFRPTIRIWATVDREELYEQLRTVPDLTHVLPEGLELTAGDLAPRMTTLPCLVHSKHIPESHVNHRHHVWPLADGGPSTNDNTVVVCPTGHGNIHALLKELLMHDGVLPYSRLRQFARQERAIAMLGWERIQRKAM